MASWQKYSLRKIKDALYRKMLIKKVMAATWGRCRTSAEDLYGIESRGQKP